MIPHHPFNFEDVLFLSFAFFLIPLSVFMLFAGNFWFAFSCALTQCAIIFFSLEYAHGILRRRQASQLIRVIMLCVLYLLLCITTNVGGFRLLMLL
jgi:hypothetical protein